MMLGRLELQSVAKAKMADAELLFEHSRYSNAYYLFGYAAEIALKSRIARACSSETIPDKRFVERIYSHDLNALVSLSGLRQRLDERRGASPPFNGFWSTVSDWSPQSRYATVDQFTCIAMRDAMTDTDEGVFKWLESNW